jgi:bla regulator protein BlaR1
MIAYFLKSILCLGIFLLVYLLFLEKEKMHRFNRWYLLGTILFAFFVPLVGFEVTQDSLPVLLNNYFVVHGSHAGTNLPVQAVSAPISSAGAPADYFSTLLLAVYSLVTIMLLARFARNLYRILASVSANKTVYARGVKLVLLEERTASYSFLNYIFISEEDYANKEIEEELITHELTHIQQKHSWDIIFIEFLQIVFWFNPVLFLYKKAIQLNHEYLADEAVISTHRNVPAYQSLLLDKAGYHRAARLSSSFNYSVTKKRLVMMTKTHNRTMVLLKKLAVLPLLACAIVIFSTRTVVAQEKIPASPAQVVEQKQPGKQKGQWMQAAWGKIPFTKEGVSAGDLAKYRAFEKKFGNLKPKSDFPEITEEEKHRMEAIFKKMSKEQQQSCQVYFIPPIGPSRAEHPKDTDLNRWAKSKIYGVLIDGEPVSKEDLAKYASADFSDFSVGLKLNEEWRKKKGYSYEVLLTTNDAFKKYNADRRADKHFQMAISFTKGTDKVKEFDVF